jgi:uncharacterized protein YaiI (UPF0178 family)
MLDLYVDADACPVKQEIYKVARRCGLRVLVVSNVSIFVPQEEGFSCVAVGMGDDAADDWIAEQIGPDDICITADIPLAARCLERGAFVLGPRGKEFTADSIGDAVATRDLLSDLRGAGVVSGGPAPMSQRDRSRFLNQLDRIVQAVRLANRT